MRTGEDHQLTAVDRADGGGRHPHLLERRRRVAVPEPGVDLAGTVQPLRHVLAAGGAGQPGRPADHGDPLLRHGLDPGTGTGLGPATGRPAGGRRFGGVLLRDDQMGVGPAEAEAGDRGRPAAPDLRLPRAGLAGDLQLGRVHLELLGRRTVPVLAGDRPLLHRQDRLDQRHHTGRPTRVADQRLVGGDDAGAVPPVVPAQGGELGEVASRRPGGMGVDPVHVVTGEPAGRQRAAHREVLAGGAGRVDRLALAVGGGAERPQHAEDPVAVRLGPAEPLEHHHTGAVGEDHAVRLGVERVHRTPPRQPLQLGEEHRPARREGERATADRDVLLAREQALDADVDGVERGRAGGVDHLHGRVGRQHTGHRLLAHLVRQEARRVRLPAVVAGGERAVHARQQPLALRAGDPQLGGDLGGEVVGRGQHARLLQVLAAVGGVADVEGVAVGRRPVHAVQRLDQRVPQPERGQLGLVRGDAQTLQGGGIGLEVGDEDTGVLVGLVLVGLVGRGERRPLPAILRHLDEQLGSGGAQLPQF